MKTNRILIALLTALPFVMANAQENVIFQATNSSTPGQKNVLIGLDSGINISPGNSRSTFVGYKAGINTTTPFLNAFFGFASGANNILGGGNSYFGGSSGLNAMGSNNAFFGMNAGAGAILYAGNQNTFLGSESGAKITSDESRDNVFVGYNSGSYANGKENVFIGKDAGFGGTSLGTGSGNIFIGNRAGDELYWKNGNNQLIIQNSNLRQPLIHGDFGLKSLTFNVSNTSEANSRVNIVSNAVSASGLRFVNLTSVNTTPVANPGTGVLTVNGSGDVILVNDATTPNPNDYWKLIGNSGTSASTNFIGTTDNADLSFRRQSVESGFIGTSNTAFGNNAMPDIFPVGTLPTGTGLANTAFGVEAMKVAVSAKGNVATGNGALKALTTGNYNVAVGNGALIAQIGGNNNVAVGQGALATSTSSSYNTAVGSLAGNKSTGGGNTFIGNSSATAATAGVSNVFVGNQSGYSNTGSSNVIIGKDAGLSSTSGNRNTFVGDFSGNTLGATSSSFTPLTGSANTFVGKVISPIAAANSTTLGANTSNTIILADGDGRQRLYIHSNGFAGIGLDDNQIPQNTLQIHNATANTSGLRLDNLTSAFNPTDTNGKFLTVNSLGDVVLQKVVGVDGDGSVGNPFELKTLYTHDSTITGTGDTNGLRTITMDGNNILFKTNSLIEAHGQGRIYIGDAPNVQGDYRLYVEKGILTEKVRVALEGTDKWADYVFADNYKLMPLKEVEAFVKENNHLPGIESAAELTKNGLDLGDMQAKQMEKIEELTLHLIEQNKMLEKQNTEIEELKAQMKALLAKK